MFHIIARLLEKFAGVGAHKHDIVWFERIGNTSEFFLDISMGDPFAAVLVGHIQDHAIAEAPAQGYLINGAGLTMTRWPVVCRCVDVGTGVRAECYLLDCPSLSVWP